MSATNQEARSPASRRRANRWIRNAVAQYQEQHGGMERERIQSEHRQERYE